MGPQSTDHFKLFPPQPRVHFYVIASCAVPMAFFGQLRVLLYKHFKVKQRNKREALQELLSPLYIIVLLALIAWTIEPQTYARVPLFPAYDIDSVPAGPGGVLAFAPDTEGAWRIMRRAVDHLRAGSVTLRAFATGPHIEAYYFQNPAKLWAAVVLQEPIGRGYVLRMNSSHVPDTKVTVISREECRLPILRASSYTCETRKYLGSGLTRLQIAVDRALIETALGRRVGLDLKLQQFPKPEYARSMSTSPFFYIAPVYFVVAFLGTLHRLLIGIVGEKERKVKEGMGMMGLRPTAYWGSWFCTYALLMAGTVAIMTAITTHVILTDAHFMAVFLLLYTYSLSIIAMAFMLTPFFNKARTAASFGCLLTTLTSLLVVPMLALDANAPIKWLGSLSSPTALALGIATLVRGGQGQALSFQVYSTMSAVVMLCADTVLYFCLAWYFDQVIPGEYGVRQHPLLCLRRAVCCTDPVLEPSADHEEGALRDSDVESVPAEGQSADRIDVLGLSKVFAAPACTRGEEVHALRNVCLTIYSGEIFALVGKNGAGKSTLISLLTGLFPPTSGHAVVCGLRSDQCMPQIRRMVGYCPQHDVLFPQLTVQEHLRVYAGIKGVAWEALDSAVARVLDMLGLGDSAETEAEVLSGGQKRKLSLGIALIGDPKVLILDEPTSGMDPLSRRKIWDLLGSVRAGRIILLTTHFMDEADVLADRKAILADGRVRCVGTSMFLKRRYALGYDLSVSVNPEHEGTLQTIVQTHVSEAMRVPWAAQGVHYLLPVQDTGSFPALFEALEAAKDSGALSDFGLSLPSLEQVFMRVCDTVEGTAQAQPPGIASEARDGGGRAGAEDSMPTHSLPATTVHKVGALMQVYLHLAVREPQTIILMLGMPVMLLTLAKFLGHSQGPSAVKPLDLSSLPYGREPPLLCSNISGVSLAPLLQHFASTTATANPNRALLHAAQAHSFALQVEQCDLKKPSFAWHLLFNDTRVHALPIGIFQFHNALGQVLTGRGFTTSLWPFPASRQAFADPNQDLMLIIVLCIALCLQPIPFAVQTVKERERRISAQLFLFGVPHSVYWAAVLGSAFTLCALALLPVALLCALLPVHTLLGPAALAAALCTVVYQPLALAVTMVLSFLFERAETCQSWLPSLVQLVSLVPAGAVAALLTLGLEVTAQYVHYGACVVAPPYTIFGQLLWISRLSAQGSEIIDYMKWNNILTPTLLLTLAQTALYLGLLLGPLSRRAFAADRNQCALPDAAGDGGEAVVRDPLVQAERHRVQSSLHPQPRAGHQVDTPLLQSPRPDVVVGAGLWKIFQKREHRTDANGVLERATVQKVAVRDLSLGVGQGEVFGLLGPNGAGKSCTINMLIGQLAPTAGTALIDGCNVHTAFSAAAQRLGHCPQADALWDHLSGREHLHLYLVLKGHRGPAAAARAQRLVEQLQLQEFADRRVKGHSGGTKRKVSFGVAVVGWPSVVFLDEPSTGMDCLSRRFMWTIISESLHGRCGILTTHSMEEAEGLCSRLGIVVNGQLQCIGSALTLRQHYASDYLLELTCPASRAEAVHDFVTALLPGCELQEEYGRRRRYRVTQHAAPPLSCIFQELEANCTELGIVEYSFSQSTLEQAFIALAKSQEEEEEK